MVMREKNKPEKKMYVRRRVEKGEEN